MFIDHEKSYWHSRIELEARKIGIFLFTSHVFPKVNTKIRYNCGIGMWFGEIWYKCFVNCLVIDRKFTIHLDWKRSEKIEEAKVQKFWVKVFFSVAHVPPASNHLKLIWQSRYYSNRPIFRLKTVARNLWYTTHPMCIHYTSIVTELTADGWTCSQQTFPFIFNIFIYVSVDTMVHSLNTFDKNKRGRIQNHDLKPIYNHIYYFSFRPLLTGGMA